MPILLKRLPFILAIMAALVPICLYAQPDPPPDPTIPIDGGIGYLILAGAVYGVFRLIKPMKKSSDR